MWDRARLCLLQYKILLNAIGASLKRHLQGQQLTLASAAAALVDGAAAVSKYGGAQQGSRTMLDALIPASQVRRGPGGDWMHVRHR